MDGKKLTAEEIAYYKKNTPTMSSNELGQVEEERVEPIIAQATNDVLNKKQKRSRGGFKNEAEYKFYLLSVYDAADRAELGLL